MKNEPEQDLTFHTRFDRRAHGCLPLFVVSIFVLVLSALWVVPVKRPEPLRPQGLGTVYHECDEMTDFLVRELSPLPLVQPRNVDPDFDERNPLSTCRELQLRPAPPASLFGAPDSAVLDAGSLLQLPPESLLPSQGKEGQR